MLKLFRFVLPYQYGVVEAIWDHLLCRQMGTLQSASHFIHTCWSSTKVILQICRKKVSRELHLCLNNVWWITSLRHSTPCTESSHGGYWLLMEWPLTSQAHQGVLHAYQGKSKWAASTWKLSEAARLHLYITILCLTRLRLPWRGPRHIFIVGYEQCKLPLNSRVKCPVCERTMFVYHHKSWP